MVGDNRSAALGFKEIDARPLIQNEIHLEPGLCPQVEEIAGEGVVQASLQEFSGDPALENRTAQGVTFELLWFAMTAPSGPVENTARKPRGSFRTAADRSPQRRGIALRVYAGVPGAAAGSSSQHRHELAILEAQLPKRTPKTSYRLREAPSHRFRLSRDPYVLAPNQGQSSLRSTDADNRPTVDSSTPRHPELRLDLPHDWRLDSAKVPHLDFLNERSLTPLVRGEGNSPTMVCEARW